MHIITPERLEQLLAGSEAVKLSAGAKERLQWIATFVRSGESISATCDTLGIARSTFHRWLERFNPDDLSTLEEKSHEACTIRSSNISDETAALVKTYRERDPLMGKEMIGEMLKKNHGIDLSASSIGRIIERDCLYFGHTPLHWRKRMEAHRKIQTIGSEPRAASHGPEAGGRWPAAPCNCTWCRACSVNWRNIGKRTAAVSVLANIAFVAMFLATAFLEKKAGSTLGADVTTPEEIQTLSDIDFFDDAQ